ncbi:transposase domain-containing protein [Arachidicoccus sp.]|uniref:transposase domain-containing protein n=1 Tax=Arachidicoccus sp. TaxID=1872624 RepID=UPI003D2469D1
MFSLVENCKLHEVNVLDWLKDVLLRIATQSKDKLIELLPHNWKPPQRKPII